ncbi:DUF1523 family protein [Cohaesibacter celericrescens]|uniref:DUF1523 domain-containing protein n=1 Tax=Cohaesibacter celericrescens TaxID=2067669 RepID=A0A2N5XUN4_9HYPH|nr:DUF1523 family protein [Cohaesibacter celericrescens]PLW78128.1 DUF1523 domain-containing protein [Cohaesibacter celericrescens]
MQILKWAVGAIIAILVVLFLHYTLPSRDIVRIVGTDVKRMDIGASWFWASPDAGTTKVDTRDVRFINAELPNGKPYVYRNEDTDWSWPPYLKFDSGNLTAQAQSLAQKNDNWVAVTHYGWRIKLFTIFPNVVKIKPVAGPDVFLIPWFNIVFFMCLAAIAYFIVRMIRIFKVEQIDPVLDEIEQTADEMTDNMSDYTDQAQSRLGSIRAAIKAWFKRWFGEVK